MSKLRQPVFERPEEPDFIRRLKHGHMEEAKQVERPMTDAPAREDDLPAVANDISKDDLSRLRLMHGLNSDSTSVSPNADDTDVHFPNSKSTLKKAQLAGLGSGSADDMKRRKKIKDLKVKRGNRNDELSDGIVDDANMTASILRTSPKTDLKMKRKKMKMSFED